MARLILEGGHLITPLEERLASICLDGALIESIGETALSSDDKRLNVEGCLLTPGLIDLQVNGGPECDLWGDPTSKELDLLRKHLAASGVTSFLPTLITDDIGHLKKNIAFLAKAGASRRHEKCASDAGLAHMIGIHLEGPCLSPERPGVHPPQHLRPLSKEVLAEFVTDNVALVTLAPELDPEGKSVAYLADKEIKAALGHSNASYEEAIKAFDRGVRIMTHTFNALPPLHHRALGAVGAALLDERVFCCAIADGAHLERQALKLIFKLKGQNKFVLVTDAAHIGTSKGGLVGSSITLNQAVTNVVEWGVCTFAQAVRAASYNAAQAVGMENCIGHLESGKSADIVVWDKETLAVKHVIVAGQLIF